MKKAVIFGCLLTLISVSFASAQHYQPSANSRSMIQSLRGHQNLHSHSNRITRRSIETSSRANLRGHASHQCGESFSYQVDSGCQLCLNKIQFRKNSTELADRRSYSYLQDLAYALNSPELRYQRFVIEGHASAEGSYSSNLYLSQCRANAIFDFLVRHGVSPSRLVSVGHGEAQAHHSAHAPEYLRAADRKVMVFKMAR